jgi:hypothetical protein
MRELILRAANELGLSEHVSIQEPADSPEALVTVSYPPKAIQTRIAAELLMEADLSQLKIILSDLARMAQQ